MGWNPRTKDPLGAERKQEIDEFVDQLRRVLHSQPYLRAGQVMYNALVESGVARENLADRLFSVEDDQLFEVLKKMVP